MIALLPGRLPLRTGQCAIQGETKKNGPKEFQLAVWTARRSATKIANSGTSRREAVCFVAFKFFDANVFLVELHVRSS